MTSIGAALRAGARRLAAAGIETPALDARILAGDAFGLSREMLFARDAETASAEALACFERHLARRLAHEPVALITGARAFWRHSFRVTRDTLVPRPETETLVALALAHFGPRPPRRLLDLGTGSGCLLLSLLADWPGTEGYGVDLSGLALAVARSNAQALDLGARAHLLQGAWGAALSGPFELVVANPPYIPHAELQGLDPDVRDHEPPLALDGGADGLAAYRALLPDIPRLLAPGGVLILEIGATQAAAVGGLCAAAGLGPRQVARDLGGRPRAVLAATPGPGPDGAREKDVGL